MPDSPYLTFKLLDTDKKTQTYQVLSTQHGFMLGEVKWFGRWRQYTFFPQADSVFNKDCLIYISEFLDGLNKQHSKEIKEAKWLKNSKS